MLALGFCSATHGKSISQQDVLIKQINNLSFYVFNVDKGLQSHVCNEFAGGAF
jgi:hypothetical protein